MKLRITKGTTIRGVPANEGEVYDVDPETFNHLVYSSKFAEAVKEEDAPVKAGAVPATAVPSGDEKKKGKK